MAAEWQPKFADAVFCAGCHLQRQAALVPGDSLDAKRWPDGLPIHDTYQEWLDGPYGEAEVPCQHCHMPADYELVNSTDVTTLEDVSVTFGYARPPEDNRQHLFRGPLAGEERLIDGALFVSIDLEVMGTDVEATVSLTNVGCGHAVPTGEPMRSLVLLVTASGTGCGSLPATDGMTVYDAGGALASGVEGTDTTTVGTTITWAEAAQVAQPGMVVRVVRDSGTFDDYTGIGLFDTLPADEKGLPVMIPVAEAAVTSAGAGEIGVDTALTRQAGDVLHLGEPVADGPAGAYAGHPGYAFAKVMVDAAGARQAPHYRPSTSQATTGSHRAAMP